MGGKGEAVRRREGREMLLDEGIEKNNLEVREREKENILPSV